MNKDQVNGKVKDVKGRIKEISGTVLDDESLEDRDTRQHAAGTI